MESYYVPNQEIPNKIMSDSFFGIRPIDSKLSSIPLKSLNFSIKIFNSVSSVEITQIYINLNSKPVETEYIFPIDYSTMALTKLEIKSEKLNQIIEGRIMEKAKAEEKYSDSICSGKTVVLAELDYKQPDLVKLNIGNLIPYDKITVYTKYVKCLEIEDGFWSFRLPLTYIPRYTKKTKEIIESSCIKQEFLPDAKIPYTFDFECEIKSSEEITEIRSVAHKIIAKFITADHKNMQICTKNDGKLLKPDSDLILLYKTKYPYKPSSIIQKSSKYSSYAVCLSFYPSFTKNEENNEIEPGRGEYIFIIDCSGSMGGERIELAKRALRMFIQSLPVDSLFNVICFGSNYRYYSEKSVPYNAENVTSILIFLDGICANMGGTNIAAALEYAFLNTTKPEIDLLNPAAYYPRNIFLLTDGAVKNAETTINLVRKYSYSVRVNTLGIGSGADRYLVKSCAMAGNGDYSFAIEGEDLAPKIVTALEKVSKPAILVNEVMWPEESKIELQSPQNNWIARTAHNEPFILFGLINIPEEKLAKIGKAVILQTQNSLNKEIEFLESNLDFSQLCSGEEIYQLAIKTGFEKNLNLLPAEKIALSIKYNVLCEQTAFLAVFTKKSEIQNETDLDYIKIPICITKDFGLPNYSEPKVMKPMLIQSKSGKHGHAKCFYEDALTEKISESKGEIVGRKLYEQIAELQEFTGEWILNGKLLSLIQGAELEIKKIAEKIAKIDDEEIKKKIVGTILSMQKLENSCIDDKLAWNMIFKKAIRWLKMQGIEYNDFIMQ